MQATFVDCLMFANQPRGSKLGGFDLWQRLGANTNNPDPSGSPEFIETSFLLISLEDFSIAPLPSLIGLNILSPDNSP